MRRRTRILLILELLLGVLPLSVFYIYHFPVGLFWTRSVVELATEGTVNLFTTLIAVFFVVGGLGLACLCYTLLARLCGRGFPARLVLPGVGLGIATSIGLLTISWITGGFWIDYYLYGAPLVAGAHQLYSGLRQTTPRLKAPASAAS